MHKGEATRSRLGGIDGKLNTLPGEPKFRPLVWLMEARQNLNERRLSRSVSPDEPVYFATADHEIGIA